MRAGIRRGSLQRPGRISPPEAKGLRARVVVLHPGRMMDWHATQAREELLIILAGRVRLEVREAARTLKRFSLAAGAYACVPRQTWHRLINTADAPARYLYVTAPAPSR